VPFELLVEELLELERATALCGIGRIERRLRSYPLQSFDDPG
jgi:hypothetical protein